MTERAAQVVRALFARYSADPDALPLPWRQQIEGGAVAKRARVIADYIAGMTDNYALAEHKRLFGEAGSS
jgi:dGTPase